MSSQTSGFNVEQFARRAIDSYAERRNAGTDKETAYRQTTTSHGFAASEKHGVDIKQSVAIARAAIDNYRNADSRLDHATARDRSARTVAQNFNDRGNLTAQEPEYRHSNSYRAAAGEDRRAAIEEATRRGDINQRRDVNERPRSHSVDIVGFAKGVADLHQRNSGRSDLDPERARFQTVATAAQRGAEMTGQPSVRLGQVARETVAQYDAARSRGASHEVAREQAARSTAARFDGQARRIDGQQQQRNRTNGMGL